MKTKTYRNQTGQRNFAWFLEYHGKYCCERCGYNGTSIDFHHAREGQKKKVSDTFSARISAMSLTSFAEWVKKTKYALLCRNCHAELHRGEWEIEDIANIIEARETEQVARKKWRLSNKQGNCLDNLIRSIYG